MGDILYEFNDESINQIVDSRPGSDQYIALREVRWNSDMDYKLDLRKYFITKDGEECASKGVSFFTEEGPTNLCNALIQHNYTNLRKVADAVIHHEDGIDAMAYSLAMMKEHEYQSFMNELQEKRDAYHSDPTVNVLNATELLETFLKEGE